MSKKALILILILVLCFICCFSTFAGFGLFGYLENEEKCTFKGPFSSVSSGPCSEDEDNSKKEDDNTNDVEQNNETSEEKEEVDRTGYKEYATGDYSFWYPQDWYLDDSTSILRVAQYDPTTVTQGAFINNLTLTKDIPDGFTISQNNCEDYGQQLADAVTSGYDTFTLYEYNDATTTTVNGLDACVIFIDATVNNEDLTQVYQTQFAILDEQNDQIYFLTYTFDQTSDELAVDFEDLIYSFKTK